MFDPYRKWLGIPEGLRPPTHYQLLGISPDEFDREVINAAVVRQSAFVRNFQAGKYSAEATRLLNELAAAKVCLIDPDKRARYDAQLANAELGNKAEQGEQRSVSALPAPSRHRPAAPQPPRPSSGAAPMAAAPGPVQTRLPSSVDRSLVIPATIWSAPAEPVTMALVPRATRAPRAEPGKPAVWIGLALLGCSAPVCMVAAFLIVRPRAPSPSANVAQAEAPAAPHWTAPEPFSPQQPPSREPAQPAVAAAAIVPPPEMMPSPAVAPPAEIVESPVSANNPPPRAPDNVPSAGNERTAPPPVAKPGHDAAAEHRARLVEFIERMKADRAAREAARAGARPPSQDGFFNPFEKPKVGEDTQFVGHDGGGSRRIVKEGSLLCGVACRLGQWGREKCIAEIEPLFTREESSRLPVQAAAREGYAVGAARVNTRNYVNAIQLIFMRVKDDGQLNPDDSYVSSWIGTRGAGKTFTITGDGAPIIGIHTRQGLIVDALALVVDRASEDRTSEESSSAAP